jgi:hypothetical protein
MKKLICFLLSITVLFLSANAQDPVQAVSQPGFDGAEIKKALYSVSIGYDFRRTDAFDHDIPSSCIFCFESKEQPKAFLKLGFNITLIKAGKKDLIAGVELQRFQDSNSGYMDVEYSYCPSWLCFSPGEIGDKLTVDHLITVASVYGGVVLRKFPRRNLIGTSFSARLGISYFNINDELTVKMDGGYVTSPDDELIGYKTDVFEDSENLSLIALRPSLKMEIHVGRHFSLILPEIGYEIGLYQKEAMGRTYFSKSDDDVLKLEPFKHKINGLNAMFGIAVHF